MEKVGHGEYSTGIELSPYMLALDLTFIFSQIDTDSLMLDILIVFGSEPALSDVYNVLLGGDTGRIFNRREVMVIVFAQIDASKTTLADSDIDYIHTLFTLVT